MEDGLSETFVPSCRASQAACWLQLRGAQLPGELLLHAKVSEKPFPTFASNNTIRSPPRIKTSFSAQNNSTTYRESKPGSLSVQLKTEREFTPSRQKIIPSIAVGLALPLALQPDCPFSASLLCWLHLIWIWLFSCPVLLPQWLPPPPAHTEPLPVHPPLDIAQYLGNKRDTSEIKSSPPFSDSQHTCCSGLLVCFLVYF